MIQTSRSNRFRSRALLKAAGAGTTAFSLVSTAKAQIVWSGTLDSTVQAGGTQSTALDFNQNTVADDPEANLTLYTGKDTSLILQSNTSAKTDANAFLYADQALTAGQEISATSGLSLVGEHAGNFLQPGTTTLVGFAYTSGGTHYGWAQITYSADGQTGTLNQWAYNSQAGQAIQAGQISAVPEPAACLAAAGAVCAAFAARRQFAKRRLPASPR